MSTKDPRIFLTSFLEEVRVTPRFKAFQGGVENTALKKKSMIDHSVARFFRVSFHPIFFNSDCQ